MGAESFSIVPRNPVTQTNKRKQKRLSLGLESNVKPTGINFPLSLLHYFVRPPKFLVRAPNDWNFSSQLHT